MNEQMKNLSPMSSLYNTCLRDGLIGKIMNALWRLADLCSNPLSEEFMCPASCLTFLSLNFFICEVTITTASTAYYEN